LDIVLAEGFKRSKLPKVEVYRPETGKKAACKDDSNLIAVVSDAELDWGVKQFSLSDTEVLAKFILNYCGISRADGKSLRTASHSGSP
jgi:molybdopterin-guanine dinucleotide biosynthesis protein B